MHPKNGDSMEREVLLECIKEEHYTYFHQEVLKFFNSNKENIEELITDEINYVVEAEDCEIEFISLWIESQYGSQVEFNVAVSVDYMSSLAMESMITMKDLSLQTSG